MTGELAAFCRQAAYRLANVRVPSCLLSETAAPADREGLCRVDLAVREGRLTEVRPAGASAAASVPSEDLRGRLILPCFVDLHTHLDKGHIWPRQPNPDGTFGGALVAAGADRAGRWAAEDLRRRMDFALRAAWAHGTRAIRTHIDSIPPQEAVSWPVFEALRAEWSGRIALQGVCLIGLDSVAQEPFFSDLARRMAAVGGLLGAVATKMPDQGALIERLFAGAMDQGLDLDLHVDENGDPESRTLQTIAETALRLGYRGRLTVGHCCSLAVQPEAPAMATLDLLAKAGVAVVSLPLCNLYLQGREAGRTPRWRGITLVQEMRARGIPVAFASDNTRDPFYAYGDLDMLEVFREATRIAQLDHPMADWIDAVSKTPAAIMGLSDAAVLAPGAPADFIVFKGRTYGELLSRPESERVVVRDGLAIERALPDYADLDDLMEQRG